jgi:UDPglucose 6-dehydrogenase
MKQIAVFGLGYVGLTTAVGLAQLGHKVLGFDIDVSKVSAAKTPKSLVRIEGIFSSL